MRWQFFGLVIVGLIAAVAAALLVASLKSGTPILRVSQSPAQPVGPQEVEVAVATRGLDRMTTVSEDMVKIVKMPASSAPAGHYSSAVPVAGQILVAPMAAGQPFTRRVFAASGPGVHLAATLPMGMRAMSVSLSDYSGLDGLLYPGCAVDVLASIDFRAKGEQDGEVVSATILRNIQVLAIEDQTAVSGDRPEERSAASRMDRRRRITLMVSPKQAEKLQLAMEHGIVSLAMRNPQDTTSPAGEEDMMRLAELGPITPDASSGIFIDGAPAGPEGRKPEYIVHVLRGGEETRKSFQVQDRPKK
ncbi:MAG: Flp pilus assembly protein CpaB [Phycisphaerales bacterium]